MNKEYIKPNLNEIGIFLFFINSGIVFKGASILPFKTIGEFIISGTHISNMQTLTNDILILPKFVEKNLEYFYQGMSSIDEKLKSEEYSIYVRGLRKKFSSNDDINILIKYLIKYAIKNKLVIESLNKHIIENNRGITKKCISCWDADKENMLCLYGNSHIPTLNSLCRYGRKYK